MSQINIFRYRPKHMKADLFHSIARELRMEGKFSQGDEGMVLHNERQILTWSQPNAKFGGLLFYADRELSLAKAAGSVPDVEPIRKKMHAFLEQSDLMPVQSRHRASIKLETKISEAFIESGKREEIKRVPMRADVLSHIQLDGHAVTGPRAKVRAAFGDKAAPHFMHIGLWEDVDVYKTGELLPKELLLKRIDERLKRREKQNDVRIRDIALAYWAREYRGGVDTLEPYYFVEIEHTAPHRRGEEGSGPRQVLYFQAYT